MDTLQFLKKHAAIFISFGSFVISAISFWVAKLSYQSFAKQEFVKKQIQVITDLVQSLHNDRINFQFTTYQEHGATAGSYDATIFEVQELRIIERDRDYFKNPICFIGYCNQLLNIKSFIDNPFLPKSIADELEKFYARNHYDIRQDELKGEHIIVVATKYFEEDTFERKEKGAGRIIKEANCFAMINWNNLIECSKLLEKAITNYLKSYDVKEINIRKDFKYV